MKRNVNNQIKLIKKSIDWWKEESFKTTLEVERVNVLYESGQLSEEEVLEKMHELSDKINYLAQKGAFEQRRLFEIFTGAGK